MPPVRTLARSSTPSRASGASPRKVFAPDFLVLPSLPCRSQFNLTLPAMAGQFLLLMVMLDKLWFTPVGKVLDERDALIRSKLAGASGLRVTGGERQGMLLLPPLPLLLLLLLLSRTGVASPSGGASPPSRHASPLSSAPARHPPPSPPQA